MKRAKCSKIKDLEKRLLCLKQKHAELTSQLEDERNNASSDEGIIEYQNTLEEQRMIDARILRMEKTIQNHTDTINTFSKPTDIQPGCSIVLKNSNHTLKFTLVREIITSLQREISVNSPIGSAILGKRVGDNVHVSTPRGNIHYTIKSIQ